jgi:hypothetical protein
LDEDDGDIFELMMGLLEKEEEVERGESGWTLAYFCSVGESSAAAADPIILSLASAYSFSRCSSVFIWGLEFCVLEDRAGDESGRFRIVNFGR